MKRVSAVENLGYGIVDESGEVLPISDATNSDIPMPNEKRLAIADSVRKSNQHSKELSAYEEAEAIIAYRRETEDFSRRNGALSDLVDAVGRHNRDLGAATLYDQGRAAGIRGASSAERRAEQSRSKIRDLGLLACDTCPIQEYCDEKGAIADILGQSDAVTRQRLRARVNSEALSQSNFCAVNLMSGRIPKHLQ